MSDEDADAPAVEDKVDLHVNEAQRELREKLRRKAEIRESMEPTADLIYKSVEGYARNLRYISEFEYTRQLIRRRRDPR